MELVFSFLFCASAGTLLAGCWRLAARERGTDAERALATLLLFVFLSIAMLRVLGALALLTRWPLLLVPVAMGGALLWAPSPPGAPPRPPMKGPQRRWSRWAMALLATGLAVLVFQAWLYRTTSWDALWYHVVVTHFYVMQGSTEWLDVGVEYASGYHEAVELLAAWPCAVLRTTTFDDAPQLPFAALGVALVVAWCERAAVPRWIALPMAAVWMAMPPVLLQLTANLCDVSLAVSLAATVYYLFAARPGPWRSWMVLLAACTAMAIKGSALVLLLPLAPFLVWDQLRGSFAKGKAKGALALMARAAVLFGVGLYKPIQNVIHTGNPVWPFRRTLFGHVLPGPVDPATDFGGMQPLDSFFLTDPGDMLRVLGSWYDFAPGYEPNVLSGGYGAFHALIGVPAMLLALPLLRRGQLRRPLLVAYGLFVLALQAPNPWWPRFALAASIASVVITGIALGRARRAQAPLLALALAVGVLAGARSFVLGVESVREHGVLGPLAMPAWQRVALPLGPMWPADMIESRDATFGPEDALAYESSVFLIGQFVPHDYGSRLVWVEPEGTGEAYLERLRAARARWVVLRTPRYRNALIRLGAHERWRNGDEVVLELP